MVDILISLAIGALAGWIGGRLVNGTGNGLLINLFVGILGGVLGGWILGSTLSNIINIPYVGQIMTAAIGAIILLFVISLVRGKK